MRLQVVGINSFLVTMSKTFSAAVRGHVRQNAELQNQACTTFANGADTCCPGLQRE